MAELEDTALVAEAECGEPDCDGDGHEGAPTGDDCDDGNAEVHPDAKEVCGNLVDDDCDGRTDHACATEGPPDPGGLSWSCGVLDAPSLAFVIVSVFAVLARRAAGGGR